MNQKIVFQDVVKTDNPIIRKALIQPPKYKYVQGIKLSRRASQFLIPSYVMVILGAMGSGKTHLITQLISNPDLLGYRYDRILYIGPTRYQGFIHTQQNTSDTLDIKWLQNKIQQANKWQCLNMLLVFDDVISDFKSKNLKQIQKLFYNRRHLLKNYSQSKGNISIILSSQKLTSIPRQIRDTCNIIITFRLNGIQTQQIMKQNLILKTNFKARYYLQTIKKYQFMLINLQTQKIYNSYLEQL